MGKNIYTEKLNVLIVEFFKYRDKQWKIAQSIYIIGYLISLFTMGNPAWGLLFFGQFVVLWNIIRLHQMRQRYEEGLFLVGYSTESILFKEFAVMHKKLKWEWVEREIRKSI